MKYLDFGIITPGFEFLCDKFRILFTSGRSDMMWMGGQPLHPIAQIIGVHMGIEFGFEVALGRRLVGRKAEDGFVFLRNRLS